MKKTQTGFDITKQELSTVDENFYFDHKKNAFEAVYEYDFNPDEYFGTTSSLPDGEIYLTFVTEWYMDTDDVLMYYWGEFEGCDGNNELEKVLTEKEKEFFRKLMDQFCVDKYGVSIFKLHRPLTDLERIIFPHENGEEDTEEEADEEMGEEMDEEADGDQDDDRNEYGEIVYHIRIEMRIRLPEIGTMCKSDIMPYKQTVLTNIRTAFNADTADHLFDIEDCSIDGDTVYLGINTFIMSEDDTDAQLFCEERMRPITLELEKFGYYVNDVSYDVEYVG